MQNDIYLSSDELERSDALEYGYSTMLQHPREVRTFFAGHRLVIDLDHVLFDEKDEAVELACAAAEQGLWVGIHTHYRDDPRLASLRDNPNVVIKKTHVNVRSALRNKSTKKRAGGVGRHDHPPTQETIHDRVTVVETETGPSAGHGDPRSADGLSPVSGAGRAASASGTSPS
jgi:hypothetical protein